MSDPLAMFVPLKLLTCIRVPGSNLRQGIDYPKVIRGVSVSPQTNAGTVP
jgi:hypothetical protein